MSLSVRRDNFDFLRTYYLPSEHGLFVRHFCTEYLKRKWFRLGHENSAIDLLPSTDDYCRPLICAGVLIILTNQLQITECLCAARYISLACR